jgi:uncharacterized alpha-E superfamily protein
MKETGSSMLLSRIAESVYWAGRYLERAEATARLIKVQTELFLDLPRSAGVGWTPLLAVTGSGEDFLDRQREAGEAIEEDDVIGFLAVDGDHPGSIIVSLAQARHNLRITRSLHPRDAGEAINQLFLWATDSRAQAVDRRTRLMWMDGVIRRCQLLTGIASGTMTHDDCYSFLEIGCFVERADMTTRVLDVQAHILLSQQDPDVQPYADVTWMGVLRSLEAGQAVRRQVPGAGSSGFDALGILLKDPQFPRSVEHCLTQVSRSLLELPRYDEPMAGCAAAQKILEGLDVRELSGAGLHDVVDSLQEGIAYLHDLVAETYFSLAPHDTAVLTLQ